MLHNVTVKLQLKFQVDTCNGFRITSSTELNTLVSRKTGDLGRQHGELDRRKNNFSLYYQLHTVFRILRSTLSQKNYF